MEQMRASGRVSVELVSPDGTRTVVGCGHNTLSYRCADAVASLFAGRTDGLPRTVAFVYGETDGLGASFLFTPGDRDRDQAAVVGTGLAVEDVPVNPSPRLAASSKEYTENQVTFSALTVDNAKPRFVYGFLLKDGNGPNARVLAVKRLPSPARKPENYAMSMAWTVTFV